MVKYKHSTAYECSPLELLFLLLSFVDEAETYGVYRVEMVQGLSMVLTQKVKETDWDWVRLCEELNLRTTLLTRISAEEL